MRWASWIALQIALRLSAQLGGIALRAGCAKSRGSPAAARAGRANRVAKSLELLVGGLELRGALRHALFELGRRLRERGFGLLACGELRLRLLVELGILDGQGGVGGEPHQDGLVAVGEGLRGGVRGVQQPLHLRAHQDRHGEDGEVPPRADPRQTLC